MYRQQNDIHLYRYGQKTKRPIEDKDFAECIDSKMIKDKRRPWADSNHRYPVYKTGALTTMLQSHVTERYQVVHCLIWLLSKNQKSQ